MTVTKTQPIVGAEIVRTFDNGVGFDSAQIMLLKRKLRPATQGELDIILNGSKYDPNQP